MAIYEQLESTSAKIQIHAASGEEFLRTRSRAPHSGVRGSSPSAWPRISEKLLCALDIGGVFASTLCMVHCLLLPIVIALLPVVAQPLMEHDVFHVGLAGFVLFFCLLAYLPGYMQHKDKRLLYVGAAGLTLVFFATFQARHWGEIAEVAILTVGNVLIVFGHLLNRHLLSHRNCRH